MSSISASAPACRGARSAPADQRVAARVDAALDGDGADRADHVRVDERDDAGRRLVDVEPERLGHVRRTAAAAAASSSVRRPPRNPSGSRWPSTMFASVTVGSVPPSAYAAGPGTDPAPVRADVQGSAVVDEGDAAAAGAHRVDLDRRHADRLPSTASWLVRVATPSRMSVTSKLVPPHVDDDQVADAQAAAVVDRRRRGRGGAGVQRVDRSGEDLVDRRAAAAELHHAQPAGQPLVGERPFEQAEVAIDARQDVGAQRGGRGTRPLAQLGAGSATSAARRRRAAPRRGSRSPRARARSLTNDHRKRHGDRLDPLLAQHGGDLADRALVERRQDAAVADDPLGDAEAQEAVDQGAGGGSKRRL